MGVIQLPKRDLVSQPQGYIEIDWNNPLSKGLQRVILPNTARDIVSGAIISRGTTYKSYNNIGIGDEIDLFISGFQSTDGITFDSWTDTGEASALLYQKRQTVDSNSWCAMGNEEMGGPFASHFPYSGTVYASPFSTDRWLISAIPSGKSFTTPHIIGLSVKSGSGTATFDGELWVQSSNTYYLPPRIRLLGSTHWSFPASFGGSLYVALFWNRKLSATELKEISQNPWQIFSNPKQRLYFTSSGTTYYSTLSATFSNNTLLARTTSTSKVISSTTSVVKQNAINTSKAISSSLIGSIIKNINSSKTIAISLIGSTIRRINSSKIISSTTSVVKENMVSMNKAISTSLIGSTIRRINSSKVITSSLAGSTIRRINSSKTITSNVINNIIKNINSSKTITSTLTGDIIKQTLTNVYYNTISVISSSNVNIIKNINTSKAISTSLIGSTIRRINSSKVITASLIGSIIKQTLTNVYYNTISVISSSNVNIIKNININKAVTSNIFSSISKRISTVINHVSNVISIIQNIKNSMSTSTIVKYKCVFDTIIMYSVIFD